MNYEICMPFLRPNQDFLELSAHTLRVLSYEPETIVLPLGEKATERTPLLCAFCFSATKARDEAPVRGMRV